jgi:hypothetical protein
MAEGRRKYNLDLTSPRAPERLTNPAAEGGDWR